MIKIELTISTVDVRSIFENAGLEVKMVEMPFEFYPTKHSEPETEMIPVWAVKNPNTQQYENLKIVFDKYIEKRKKDLFLNPEKLEIYELFKKTNNEKTLG